MTWVAIGLSATERIALHIEADTEEDAREAMYDYDRSRQCVEDCDPMTWTLRPLVECP